MYKLLSIFLACLLLFPGLASAQDGNELQCSESDILAAIDDALTQLQDAKSQDASTALTSIVNIRGMLAGLETQCLGLKFNSNGPTIHGPAHLPQGVYRINVTGSGYFILNYLVMDGKCERAFISGSVKSVLLNEFHAPDEEFTVETTFVSEDCVAIFQTSNTHAPYTLNIEKIH